MTAKVLGPYPCTFATLEATEARLLQLVDGTLLNSHRRFQGPIDELQDIRSGERYSRSSPNLSASA